ncbi:MAG TPA: DMT family transporter [Nitrososphaera sp.]
MLPTWTLAAAIFSGIVILPLVFESYTFYLYTIGEPSFFTFSGARLWVFLAVELLLGFFMGRVIRLHWSAGLITIATGVLIALLYNFCDDRQCYYAGPDGIGAIRMGILLFSAAIVGLCMGERSRKAPRIPGKFFEAILFGTTIALFVGYFPMALLFGTSMPIHLGLLILAFASTLPFFLSGIVTYLFSGQAKRPGIISAIAAWTVLSALFGGLRPESLPLLAIVLAAGISSTILGHAIAAQLMSRARKEISAIITFTSIVVSFVIGSTHPFLDAPMNMSLDGRDGLIATPTYYAGAYHQSDKYFATKRIEAEINFERPYDRGIEFLSAGIGAQSPNCCKDGLDYGYRADILFSDSRVLLVARAWETCDMNIACSGFPWISTMHQATVPLSEDSLSSGVMLAMEWQQDGRTVNWYYRNGAGNWTEYSSFLTPDIENPYFNLGVIDVGNPFWNPETGKAFFYQAGVSRSDQVSLKQAVTIKCPAYYDNQGIKHCVEMAPILTGNSHWKVLWKWGLQDQYGKVTIHGTDVRIGLD